MKSKHIILSAIFAIVAFNLAFTQPVNSFVDDVVMPAPNAAAFSQYTDIPVDLSSGLPQIGVPIYTVTDGELSFPINLSYHAAGIRIGEPASWVGTNWSLSANNMISRTVRGVPDELGGAGYYNIAQSLDMDELTIKDVDEGTYDSEPDLFSFSAGGYSGKFLFDENQEPFLIPKQDVKIEVDYVTSEFRSFTITLPNGTRYIFGEGLADASEYSLLEPNKSTLGNSPSKNNWYLIKIESYDGRRFIELEYEDEVYSYRNLASCSITYISNECESSVNPQRKVSCQGYIGAYGNRYMINHMKGKRLKKITNSSNTIEVNFHVDSTAREDLSPTDKFSVSSENTAYALDRIEINSDTFCTKWELDYDYYSSGSNPYEKRLVLKSVQQKSCDTSVVIPPYTFHYSGEGANGEPPSNFPGRLSKAVDHWGYYNGYTENDSNSNNLPYTTLMFGTEFTEGKSFRGTVEDKMLIGSLERVQYPTGGMAHFDFEANYYNKTLSGEEIIGFLENCDQLGSSCCTNSSDNLYFTFEDINQLNNAKIDLFIQTTELAQICPPEPPGDPDCFLCGEGVPHSIDLDIYDVETNTRVGGYSYDAYNGETYSNSNISLTSLGTFSINKKYRFDLTVLNSRGNVKIYADYAQSVTVQRAAGGLRIAEIRISPDTAQGPNDIIKTFEYSDASGTTLSSAILRHMPLYGTVQDYEIQTHYIDSSFTITGTLAVFQDYSIVPMSAVNGNHIQYKRVLEKWNGNGLKEHTFRVTTGPALSSIPVAPAPYVAGDGALLSSKTKNEAGDIVAKLTNTPKSIDYTTFDGMTYKTRNLGTNCEIILFGSPEDIPVILVEDYTDQIRTDDYYVIKKEEELDGVISVTDLFYENTNYTNPSKTIFTNGDGKKTTTTFEYAYDLSSSCMKDLLMDNYLIGIPLTTKVSVGETSPGTQVSGSQIEFGTFNLNGIYKSSCTSSDIPYPYRYLNYEMTFDGGTPQAGTWEEIGRIEKIDTASRKPAQIVQRGWQAENLEWGDNLLIKKRIFGDFEWNYDYFPNTKLVSKITDIDGQEVDYSYDALMRLEEASARGGNVKTSYEYGYKASGATQNYVKSQVDFASSGSYSALSSQETFQYFDGLGRIIQTNQKAWSENNYDIVQITEYDAHGRPFKVYEPYEIQSSSGQYISGQQVPQGLYSYYTVTEYEASPLSRKTSVTPPDWHATQFEYGTNGTLMTIAGVDFEANGLMRQTIIDPDGNKDITYTDKKGRQVLMVRKAASGSDSTKTQNRYDDKDRLTLVVPPGSTLDSTFLNFQYQYDERNRIIAKRLPDQDGWNYYLYDDRDLVTYMQDPVMYAQGRWLHTHYDEYGRVTQTGLINTTLSFDPNQTATFDEPLTKNYYDGYDFSQGAPEIYLGKLRRSDVKILGTNDWLTAFNFYDSYGRVSSTQSNHHLNLSYQQAERVAFTYDFADNLTRQYRVHTRADGSNTTILDETYFDHSGRMIESYHQIDGGTKVQLNELSYTAKDQIKTKKIGGTASSFLQQVSFDYLPNGFLKSMNSSDLSTVNSALPTCSNGLPAQAAASGTLADNALFYMQLGYDEHIITDSNPVVQNGNISQMIWRVRGRDRQLYSYEYDYLNRLEQADYSDVDSSGVKSTDNKYTTSIGYADMRGNIQSITRNSYIWNDSCWSVGQIDNLNFSYHSFTNRLKDVADNAPSANRDRGFTYYDAAQSGADYEYDQNGNLIYDPSKAMTVEYNYLNLPTIMEFPDCKVIEFVYDAAGAKLSKIVRQESNPIKRKDYLGGIEYVNNQIEAIYHSEGRVYYEEGVGRYEYNLTDHLGNVRLSFTDRDTDGVIEATDDPETNEILSETHYYPFGMTMEGPWMQNAGRENPYLYNGKELNEEFGLNWSSYGAREYDASIGRWMTVDPLAEKYIGWSPYNYTMNNPIRQIDPDGRSVDDVVINGDKAKEAVKELQKSTSLKLSRDKKTGKLSASGEAKTESDEKLLSAINSSTIKVEINATEDKLLSDGRVIADGAYQGNNLSEDKKSVTANQSVNPAALKQISEYYGKPGADMLHEVIEAFVGGEMALDKGESLSPEASYYEVHTAASKIAPQSGPTYEARQDGVIYYFVGDGKTQETTLIYNSYTIPKKK